MAEMADLTKALDQLEVTTADAKEKEASSPPKDAPAEEKKELLEEKKTSEASSTLKPHEEEATLQVGGASSSPPPAPQPEESGAEKSKPSSPPHADQPEAKSPPEAEKSKEQKATESPLQSTQPAEESKSQSALNDDILDFTSATEGEDVASSSTWDLVPDYKVSRKKGVKSDSEMDTLLKRVIKEAEASPPSKLEPLTASSSSSKADIIPKDDNTSKAAITSIAEEPAAEASAEASKEDWQEPDFSFEDGPEVPKDTVTTQLGRKNLMTTEGAMEVTSGEEDHPMVNVEADAEGHPAKRKGRPASHGAKKRTASAGGGSKAKSPPPKKAAISNKIPRAASPQPKGEGKAMGKPPVHRQRESPFCRFQQLPNQLLRLASPLQPQHPAASTLQLQQQAASPPQQHLRCLKRKRGQKQQQLRSRRKLGLKKKHEQLLIGTRHRRPLPSVSATLQLRRGHLPSSPLTGPRSPRGRSSYPEQRRHIALTPTVLKASITTYHHIITSAQSGGYRIHSRIHL